MASDGIRQDLPVAYKTTTLRTLMQALKAVFHHQTAGQFDYQEEQFRDLNIVPEWPLSRQEWPAIVVKFHEGQITNAGVGHIEEFEDDNGLTRRWMHRKFNGSVEFELLGLSPYDLMVLSDALIEILSFGKLDAVWSLFYDRIYGSQQDPYSVLSLLYQLNLNSDVLSGSGMNVSPAPWQAEDAMVYTCSYDLDLSGGFYNTIPPGSIGLGYVREVDVDAYIQAGTDLDGFQITDGTDEPVPFPDDLDNGWTNPFIYNDDAIVTGRALILVSEQTIIAPTAAASASAIASTIISSGFVFSSPAAAAVASVPVPVVVIAILPPAPSATASTAAPVAVIAMPSPVASAIASFADPLVSIAILPPAPSATASTAAQVSTVDGDLLGVGQLGNMQLGHP